MPKKLYKERVGTNSDPNLLTRALAEAERRLAAQQQGTSLPEILVRSLADSEKRKTAMGSACALCKLRNPPRTHMFPQNSRPELQLKWMKALDLSQENENKLLAEMREMEEQGNRPRWCTYHFEYDEKGIHQAKYYDPEEGRKAQEEGDNEEEEEGEAVASRSPTPERRRSSKRLSAASAAAATAKDEEEAAAAAGSSSAEEGEEEKLSDVDLMKILRDAGIFNNPEEAGSSTKKSAPVARKAAGGRAATAAAAASCAAAAAGGGATIAEKTLQSILQEAGLPVPETLQAKTGITVKNEELECTPSPVATKRAFSRQLPNAIHTGAMTVGQAKQMGTFISGASRGGSTMLSPRSLVCPVGTNGFHGASKQRLNTNMRLHGPCYNYSTMEKYDDEDAIRAYTMPCAAEDCKSEISVMISRAQALEDQFEELADSVMALMEIYRTKGVGAAPSLATVQGRAAQATTLSSPIYRRPAAPPTAHSSPASSGGETLAMRERRERRETRPKEAVSLLTGDLIGKMRRAGEEKSEDLRKDKEKEEEEEEEEEGEEYAPDLDCASDEEEEPKQKRPRRVSSRDADTSPPQLEVNED